MTARRIGLLLILLGVGPGCGGDKSEEDSEEEETDDDGACGAFSTYDITVIARVEDSRGAPLADMLVTLDDLATPDPSLGEGTTDADGEVNFLAAEVEFAEDCLATLFDYRVIATDPSGAYAEASDDMNSNLYNATLDGSLEADVRNVPLVMDTAG